jgi:hypothetical protein
VEQELACTEDHPSASSEVESLLRKPSISHKNKLRLLLLYALRYEREPSNRIAALSDILGADAKHAVAQVSLIVTDSVATGSIGTKSRT